MFEEDDDDNNEAKKKECKKKGKIYRYKLLLCFCFVNKENAFQQNEEEEEKTTLMRIRMQFNYFGLVDGGEFKCGIGTSGGNVRANNFENGCCIICGNGIVDRR